MAMARLAYRADQYELQLAHMDTYTLGVPNREMMTQILKKTVGLIRKRLEVRGEGEVMPGLAALDVEIENLVQYITWTFMDNKIIHAQPRTVAWLVSPLKAGIRMTPTDGYHRVYQTQLKDFEDWLTVNLDFDKRLAIPPFCYGHAGHMTWLKEKRAEWGKAAGVHLVSTSIAGLD